MNKFIISLAILLNLVSFQAFAQPANNTCAGAISLTVTNGSCNSTDYTNVGSTTAGNPPTPACWSPNNMSHTVWFSFVAPSTSVQIGTNFPNGPGDMTNTQLAAYSGTCGSLVNIGCNEDLNTALGVTHTTLALHGLTVGNTYYLIVDGNGTSTGTFGICVEQILPVGAPQPVNDCPTAQFLCDKNSLSVANGTGSPGAIQEAPTCFGAPGERAAWWYTFTVGTSGTLCFTITPSAVVDYDWAFYNTTTGCLGTQMACNWSGTTGATGATGANGSGGAMNDVCMNVVAGQTYSILVDRFTATSSAGFTLSFGGTATFAAPNPTFTSTTVCVGTATQFTNTTSGSNTYSWNFGDGATSTAQNPTHTYTTAGTYTASLLVTTNPGGCQNIVTQSVTVNPVPTVNAGPDASVCSGLCVNLAGSTNATGAVGPSSFSNGGSYAIPDNNATGVSSPISVSGIAPTTIAAGSIASVCLNITHTFDGDLDIFLVCPGGTQIELSTDNGGGSNNYTNTCFTVADPIITGGTAPFTGSYSPEQAFTLLNGCTANGTWNLLVKDDAGGDVGSITGWTITFNNTLPAFTWTPTTFMTGSTTLTPQVCPTATTTYTLNATSGGTCTASDQVTITVPAPVTPTFNAVGPYCSNAAIPALPTTSTNGITGSWSPAINNTATTTYTFTPAVGQCATTTTLTITITPNVTPTFNAVGSYCSGAAIPALPTSSTNIPAITGTWSPAINNTATTTYTFTPTAGQCATTQTLTITIDAPITPTFTAVPPQCTGSAIAPLPTTSTNGITGTWSPAINNTATTTYTFTPAAGQCATTTTMTITITSSITPTFAAVAPICSGAALAALPTSSTNVPAITGTWSPAINNTTTTTYTFTPAAGQCATTTTMTITVNPNITPTFTAVPAICSGGALAALPTTSNNGINGTWSPAINNTATTTYTFTPTAPQCATTTTMTITVNPLPIPTAIADSVNCNGGSTGSVTVTGVVNSPGGFNYSWNTVPVQNTQTATGLPIGTYTVTVTDQNTTCTGQTTATISQPVVLTASETHVNPTCAQGTNGTATATPAGGTAPYTYSWNTIPVQTTQTATGLSAVSYICTITDYHGCTTTTTATLVDPAGMVLNTTMTQANCGLPDGSATVSVTSGGSGNFSYSWNTSPVQNTATATAIPSGTYIATVTDVTLGCISTDTITVTTTLGITATATFISDALCNGSTDGKAYAYPTGGAPIYSYSWNTVPVQTNDTVTAAAGTYMVTITDGSGCSGTASVTIGQPTVVVASITGSTDETCLGANNGTATAGGLGGTGTYTYSWNTTPIQNTQTATGLAPGTYIVTVLDNNLCADTASVTINPGPTMTATHTSTNVSCFGGSNGAINVTILGAPGAISYNWMPGSIGSEDPIGLTAGTYTLTATSLGCSVNDTVTITQPTQLVAVLDSAIDVTCNGGANGHAHGSATGGTGAYAYSWNTVPVQNTSAAFGLPQGIYTLTVTDSLGCQSTINATIIEPAPLAVNTGSIAAYCGVNQGTVWAFPTNGTAPYTYIWDSSAVVLGSTDTLSGLYPGSYHLQVLDNNGCKYIGDVVVSPAPGGTASISATTDVSCNGGSDGTATVSMSGAFPPYSYQWDAAAANQITNPATGLALGTYGVNVTDAYGCIMSTTANITEPTPLTTTLTQNNTVCPNSCDGTATATPAGGTSPYSYLWNDPSSQITQTAASLCLGTFTVQITDDEGCTISDSITINNPPAMELDTTVVEANCNQADGSAEVFITANGQVPFTFEWTDGVSTLSMTSQLANVIAGTYFVTVTDFNLCSVTTPVTIPNLAGPQIDSTSKIDVLCFGNNTGSATVSVSGGTTPYTYLWNDALTQTTPSATNLIAGTYIVGLVDDNGCNLSTSITITEPAQLVLTSGFKNPTCFGDSLGFVFVNVMGGTMPYSYSWNDPLTQLNDSALNLPANAGGYTVTVTDSNGCIETANVVLTDPALFTINVNGTDVSCFGGNDGTATISENNGFAPFTYLWNDPSTQSTQTATGLIANTYNVIVRDDNDCMAIGSITINEPVELTIVQDTVLDVSCNGLSDGFASVTVNGGTGAYNFTWELGSTLVSILQSPSTLAAGTYLVTVTDENLCSASMFITVNEPTPLTSTYVAVDALCAGDNTGYAFVSPTGGVAPYTFQWDAAAALQITDTATGLTAGTYGVFITDDNGCPHPVNGIVIGEPQPLNFVSSTSSPSTCGSNNGEASVSVGGGSGALNYAWNSTPAQFTAIASNLSAGNYTVVVTDQNGCLDSTNVNVTDLGSPMVTIPTSTNVSCNGAADGTATADVTGGTAPYTYLWNNTNADTTLTATGLDAQTYNITVTDSNGCVASASIVIQQANALVAVIGTPTHVSCNGLTDGTATVMVAGGIAPFTYLWDDAAVQSTTTASSLGAGAYIVEVRDSNNCMAKDTVTITEPQVLVVGLDSLKHVNCFGGSDGYIDVNATGGTFPYTSYAWTPSVSTGQTANGLAQGSYDVVVTDNNGCTATNTYVVNEPTALLITMDSTASTCGNANGSAEVSSTVGGTTPYFYNWNDPANQQTALASNLSANTYNVTVIDNNGCSISSSITVNDLPGPIIDSVTKTNVLCSGELNGTATVFASGGSALNYVWTPSGQTTSTADSLGAGVYSVIVSDINGCTTNQGGITITQPFPVTAEIDMPATACYGQIIQLFGVGGGGTPFAPPASPYNISWGAPFNITSSGSLYDTVTTNTTYNIVVLDANSCPKFYDESVVVGDSLDITADDQIICQGQGISLTASTTGGNTANGYTYNWFVDNTGIYTTPVGVVNPTNPANVEPVATTDYMVYVSDGCSRNDTTYVTVTVNDTSLVAFNPIAPDCPILYAEFKPVSTDIGLTYSWDFDGDGNVDQTTLLDTGYYAYSTPGTYDVALSVTNLLGCKSAFYSPKHVIVYNLPIANFIADPQVETILNPVINFTDLSSTDVIGWYWDFGDLTNDTMQNPTHTYQDTGYYPVQLLVTNGQCKDSIIKMVQIKPDFFFAIPNTFTPDGDGVNDIFRPGSLIGVSEKEYNFYIFDRWGEKIWEGHDLEDGWDGTVNDGSKLAQTDTYVWLIKLKGIDGAQREYRGHINLLK
ncbi:MAG: PKD domain-containing protein [Bacteroidetes bacterium]|nr:PKD domain-containing protein [Bacteroidota bacterium]